MLRAAIRRAHLEERAEADTSPTRRPAPPRSWPASRRSEETTNANRYGLRMALVACSSFNCAGSVLRRGLSGRVQRLEKRHERGRLRRTPVVSVGWHVATALDHLADELVLRKLDGHSIQLRPSLASRAAQRVAVVTLLGLKNECPLPL